MINIMMKKKDKKIKLYDLSDNNSIKDLQLILSGIGTFLLILFCLLHDNIL